MLSRTALCINSQALTRVNAVSQKMMYRTLHVTCRIRNIALENCSALKISKYAPLLGTCTKRYASTIEATSAGLDQPAVTGAIQIPIISAETSAGGGGTQGLTSKLLENIPDPPAAPTVLEAVSYAGEPTFASLGLGSWWPPGIVQQGLEILHVSCGLPWWEAIALGTIVLRFLLFPLVIKAQINGAHLNNNLPEMTRLQAEMTEARQDGDHLASARKAREMMALMRGKSCNPLRGMIVPFVQAPIFISVFFGLRKMAELPVESMREGGLWWFTDLTIPDPYYILPVITAATLAATIELGTDTARAESMGMMRYVLRAVPVIILPFTLKFSAALLCYWVSSNFISLLQVAILRIPKVRLFFKIPPLKVHPPAVKANRKGFVAGVKDSIKNLKATREMNARYEVEEVQFHRAGRGPIKQTFSYDPTKQFLNKPEAVMAKKR